MAYREDIICEIIDEWHEQKSDPILANEAVQEMFIFMGEDWQYLDISIQVKDIDIKLGIEEVILPIMEKSYKKRLILKLAGIDEDIEVKEKWIKI